MKGLEALYPYQGDEHRKGTPLTQIGRQRADKIFGVVDGLVDHGEYMGEEVILRRDDTANSIWELVNRAIKECRAIASEGQNTEINESCDLAWAAKLKAIDEAKESIIKKFTEMRTKKATENLSAEDQDLFKKLLGDVYYPNFSKDEEEGNVPTFERILWTVKNDMALPMDQIILIDHYYPGVIAELIEAEASVRKSEDSREFAKRLQEHVAKLAAEGGEAISIVKDRLRKIYGL